MKAFWLTLKSTCKSFKLLVLIIVLLSFQIMLITQFKGESIVVETSEIRTNNLYSSTNASWVHYWQRRYKYFMEYGEPLTPLYSDERVKHDLKWYQYEKGIADKIKEAFINKDWPTYNHSMAEKRLLEWYMYQMMGAIERTPENFFAEDWNQFKPLIYDPDFDQLPYWYTKRMETALPPQQTMWSAAHHLHLLKEGLPPMGPHDTSPWGFLFNFMRRGLPSLLAVIVLLMTVNLVHRDKQSGSIKSTLQIPRKRTFYLFRKGILGFISSFFVVLIPQVLVFLGLGLKCGFAGGNYPVIIDKGILSWSPLSKVGPLIGKANEFGLSQYRTSWDIHNRVIGLGQLDIIPLWQFLILALISLALFILFCTVVGILISILVKNGVLAQVTGIGIIALGTVFGRFYPHLRTTSWDLFSKVNVIPILEGSHQSTYLNSLVAMCIAITLLFSLSVLVFRKQDIFTD